MTSVFASACRDGRHQWLLRFVILFVLTTISTAMFAANISGQWYGTFNSTSGDSGPINVVFTQTGSTLVGFLSVPGSSCIGSGGQISGVVNGNTLQFGNIAIAGGAGPNAITFTGSVDSANSLHGNFAVHLPCTPDTGTWVLSTNPTSLSEACPDCVHASGATMNTVPLWSGTSPATLSDSLLTQDPTGVFHVGNFLQFGGASGGLSSVGPNSGLVGRDTNTIGANIGVFGQADGDNGAGVLGRAVACTASAPCSPSPSSPNAGFTAGVRGIADGTTGYGVRGFAGSATGTTHGMEGRVVSPDGKGAEGWNLNTGSTGTPIGVYGRTFSAKGVAVWGVATTTAAIDVDSTTGVLGSGKTGTAGFSGVENGVGVWGANFGTNGWTRGVLAQIFSSAGEAAAVEAPNGGDLLVGRGLNYEKVLRVTNNGDVHIKGTVFPNGADFAESVRVDGASSEYEAGDVLVIDTASNRQLTVAAEPYSARVAGIYSTKPGMLASPSGIAAVDATKEVPLAVVGIVPCKASAENGAIRIGDLLVTATKAGYAMKGTDRSRMLGAIVGKALEPLREGTGVIQVLVTLQ